MLGKHSAQRICWDSVKLSSRGDAQIRRLGLKLNLPAASLMALFTACCPSNSPHTLLHVLHSSESAGS